MQRYLRPDLMETAGVTSFDGWAATFGEVVTEMEMAPAGGFRLKDRFAKFTNVPEMLRMRHVVADVKMPEDLKLPVPAIAPRASDGRREPEIVVLDPTPERLSIAEWPPDLDRSFRRLLGVRGALGDRVRDPALTPTTALCGHRVSASTR